MEQTQKTILILAANPKDTTQVRFGEEVRKIKAGLERAKNRDQFKIEDKLAAQVTDIRRAMLDLNPQIVHFCGHGKSDEGLIFEDETGSTKVVDGEALARLFKEFSEVECVVLNCCNSEKQAEAIAQHVNYVIGMKKAIGDAAAIEFAVGFYDALGSGRSYEFAYNIGCNAISLDGSKEQSTPIIKTKYIQSLLKVLNNLKNSDDARHIKNAYKACSPEYWDYLETNEPKEILENIETMSKGDSECTRVERFVACLAASCMKIVYMLREWAEINKITKFEYLLNQEREKIAQKKSLQKSKNTNSYLLILLEKSNQNSPSNNSDSYRIKAWFIPDIENYKSNNEKFYGCEQVNLGDYENQTFSIDKIGDILNYILNKNLIYNFDSYSNLAIEIFLPLNVLNHPVDCWEFKDGTEIEDLDLGFTQTQAIGEKYKFVVRSYERWRYLYPKQQYRYSWEKKWKQLEKSGCINFSPGSEDTVNDLISPKQEIIGLKVVKAPQKTGKGSIFAAIIKTAIPVALWLRENPSNLDCNCEIDQLINSCSCIDDLPVTLKDKRTKAEWH